MRTRETNCSMPSGDSAQAALYSFYIMNNFPKGFIVLGGVLGSAQFLLAVTFSRVYFHCHYLGDTIVGMIIGVAVGLILQNIHLKELMKNIYLSVIGVNDDIYAEF